MARNKALDFGQTFKAAFVERPNRFLLRCHSPKLGTVDAFLPNPGRMQELLLPGTIVHVMAASQGASGKRKTKYTVLAAERDGAPVFLHTHLVNEAARTLIEEGCIPEFEHAEVVRAEVPVGHSRFDFLLRDAKGDIYLEVKSCTLFANGVAMFPDAVTERGRRHLVELAAIARGGTRTAVMFVIQSPNVQYFMPNYHTDLAFSETLLAVRDQVNILPVAVDWGRDLSLRRQANKLAIPWDYLEEEAQDRGSYLVVLAFEKEHTLAVGKLGHLTFQRGFYVYAGSAMANLSARLARHQRKTKKRRWHLDYIRPSAASFEGLAIRSSARLECPIAKALSETLKPGPKGFGSSDCRCPTHLFYSEINPFHRPEFHTLLEAFRMRYTSGT